MKQPTKRQSQILALMSQKEYSMRELAQMLGLSSPATVHKHVQNLKKSGLLKSSKNKPQKPLQIPIIGGISQGKKIELFLKVSYFDLPPTLLLVAKALYGFLIRDESFIDHQMAPGDLVIVEAQVSPKFGELILAHSKEAGAVIGRAEELSEYQIQGVIRSLIRSYSPQK